MQDSITLLTFFVERKKKKTKEDVISKFVWRYFGTPKIEDKHREILLLKKKKNTHTHTRTQSSPQNDTI